MSNRESTRTLSRARVCVLLLLAGLWSAGVQAQVCGEMYRLADSDPTDLYTVDTSTNPWTFNFLAGGGSFSYNAMAYRVATDTLYAIEIGVPHRLLQINVDDEPTPLGTVSGLPSAGGMNYHVAEFAPDDRMYVRNTIDANTLYRINVDTLTVEEAIPMSPPSDFADLAWLDGLFYGVASGPDLVSVDTSGNVTVIGPTGVGGFGAMYSASNGVFGISNAGGAYQFDIETGAGILVSDAPPTPNNDGARCSEAPLDILVDLSVTKDDGSDTYVPGEDVVYQIVVTNVGEFGVQNAEVNDPLPNGITDASWKIGRAHV